MRRVTRPGGLVSFYVWDYPGGGMGFIERFWKAAAELDPKAADLDEGRRFPFCTEAGLRQLCGECGIANATVAPIEIETQFSSFEDFWQPFLLGAGPAPGYCKSLSEDARERLRQNLVRQLGEGEIALNARAWAMKAPIR